MEQTRLSTQELLVAYRHGCFPMADDLEGEIYWYSPDPRAIIPLDRYKPQKSLRPVLNQQHFQVTIDTAFQEVITACAQPRSLFDGVWISQDIIRAYTQLHQRGWAHSVEAWQNGKLAGGLYGVTLGSAYFGESMFHRISNASKVAFHYLVQILRGQGFTLLDTQFINDNVRRFGAIEVPRPHYMELLSHALQNDCQFQWPESPQA